MQKTFNHIIIDKYIESNEFGKLLGIDFNIIEPGVCEYRFEVNHIHTSIPKVAHGGFVAALMDATMGVGALSLVCEDMKVVSTLEIKVSFYQPVLSNSQVRCVSTCLKKGKSILFMEADLKNLNGQLLAKGSGTFNAYQVEKVLF
jgi:uncharacterized protein (TIGR00369 family)